MSGATRPVTRHHDSHPSSPTSAATALWQSCILSIIHYRYIKLWKKLPPDILYNFIRVTFLYHQLSTHAELQFHIITHLNSLRNWSISKLTTLYVLFYLQVITTKYDCSCDQPTTTYNVQQNVRHVLICSFHDTVNSWGQTAQQTYGTDRALMWATLPPTIWTDWKNPHHSSITSGDVQLETQTDYIPSILKA